MFSVDDKKEAMCEISCRVSSELYLLVKTQEQEMGEDTGQIRGRGGLPYCMRRQTPGLHTVNQDIYRIIKPVKCIYIHVTHHSNRSPVPE